MPMATHSLPREEGTDHSSPLSQGLHSTEAVTPVLATKATDDADDRALDNTRNTTPPLDWAEMQIRTSANWSLGSLFWLLMSGGLNYQIEHHLFPGVAHVHYPEISVIVRDECARRGIPYTAYPSFRAIFSAHVLHLYRLGRAPEKSLSTVRESKAD